MKYFLYFFLIYGFYASALKPVPTPSCIKVIKKKITQEKSALRKFGLISISVPTKYPLHCAAFKGQARKVEDFIKKGVNVTEEDKRRTPLDWAITGLSRYGRKDKTEYLEERVRENYLKTIKLLIKAGGVETSYWQSPLHLAVTIKDIEVVSLLIENGADVNARDKAGGKTALHLVRDLEIAKLLIKNGADVNARDDKSRTPLHSGGFERAKLLIENGADVNARDKDRKTPLHGVSRWEDAKAVSLLIQNKADVKATDNEGNTPLHIAVNNANFDAVSSLINYGADVNARNNEGETLILLASALWGGNSIKILSFLKDKGGHIKARDRQKNTALHFASEKGDMDMISFILKNGVDMNARNNEGETPLYWAIDRGRKKMKTASFLIENGADISIRNNQGETLLHITSNVEIAKLFIRKRTIMERFLRRKGIDINAKDNQGNTALHRASRNGWKEMVSFLIGNGADVHMKNNRGENPLDRTFSSEVKLLLIRAGARPSMPYKKK